MTVFICATPYHILASSALAAGEFSTEETKLIILDHFNLTDEMVENIKDTKVFGSVEVYKSNKKSKLNNVKRLVNAFIPPKVMRILANDRNVNRVIFFALDFIDMTYLAESFSRKRVECEILYGDDGIGTYINDACYTPKKYSEMILKLNGRKKYLTDVRKIYVYKPEYMAANKNLEALRILQNEATLNAQKLVSKAAWPIGTSAAPMSGAIVYFEQPRDQEKHPEYTKNEQRALNEAIATLEKPGVIKMHPRSLQSNLWSDYQILEVNAPFEAILMQKTGDVSVMMSDCSTAQLSSFLIDRMAGNQCASVILNHLLGDSNSYINEFIKKVASSTVSDSIKVYCPETWNDYRQMLQNIKMMGECQ